MDETLKTLRKRIDAIDASIVSLLAERAAVAGEIRSEKERLEMPVEDSAREFRVLAAVTSLPHSPLRTEDLVQLYQQIIRLTRESQQRSG